MSANWRTNSTSSEGLRLSWNTNTRQLAAISIQVITGGERDGTAFLIGIICVSSDRAIILRLRGPRAVARTRGSSIAHGRRAETMMAVKAATTIDLRGGP